MLPQPPVWLILIAFVCALGPLVFFHELGHYLVARLFKIPAEVFSIGFGRELFGWTDKQGTRWKVAWLPLGGYVKFVGDMTPASNPAELDSIPEHLRHRAFQLRPVWQRFLVVLAGPALVDPRALLADARVSRHAPVSTCLAQRREAPNLREVAQSASFSHFCGSGASFGARSICIRNVRPPPGYRLPEVVCVRLPEGLEDRPARKRLLDEFGIEVAGGLGTLAGKVWRVGLMGESCNRDAVKALLDAIDQVLSGK